MLLQLTHKQFGKLQLKATSIKNTFAEDKYDTMYIKNIITQF